MTGWKGKIDLKTSSLLAKAARNQIEFGMGEMIVSRAGVNKKRQTLIRSGRKKKRSVRFRSTREHEKAISNCHKCPLGDTRTKFVYARGNPGADVMFIGEAPGREEDLQGEPFVGKAGQLFDKILAAIKFDPDEVYIANILKCRPPENRDPLPDEINTCLPHLMEQIQLVKPKIICALGRVAAQALLKTTTPLGKLRKKWHDFNGIPFLVTYHPAALLRFQSYKKDVWEDVQVLRAKYDELVSGD